MRGAGGNRTPVHQLVNEPATTIPDSEADAASPAGRLTITSDGRRSVFPECQPSFRLSAFFLAVILRFWCRAAVDRPRAAFLLTMSLRSPEDQAARANCSLAILIGAPFSESEQLGSQTRPATLTSKPVSPVGRLTASVYWNTPFDNLPRGNAAGMPRSWSNKRERQDEHIKQGVLERGEDEGTAEEIAARTVNKERARSGEAKTASKLSVRDISSGRRGGLRSHKGSGGRTHPVCLLQTAIRFTWRRQFGGAPRICLPHMKPRAT
jgi:hypothetical protein